MIFGSSLCVPFLWATMFIFDRTLMHLIWQEVFRSIFFQVTILFSIL